MEKEFKNKVLVMPLAAARVLIEDIPKETDTETLEEVIRFSDNLVIGWQRVEKLAVERLQVIREKIDDGKE